MLAADVSAPPLARQRHFFPDAAQQRGALAGGRGGGGQQLCLSQERGAISILGNEKASLGITLRWEGGRKVSTTDGWMAPFGSIVM